MAASFYVRLKNAVMCKCPRTAKARIRDIARLCQKQGICSYEEKYNELINLYKL